MRMDYVEARQRHAAIAYAVARLSVSRVTLANHGAYALSREERNALQGAAIFCRTMVKKIAEIEAIREQQARERRRRAA